MKAIHHFDKKNLIFKESFVWAPNASRHVGNLINRTFEGFDGICFSRTLKYDALDNVVEEALIGNLTGQSDKDIFVKTFRTSRDGWHLPLEENDGRKQIIFEYYSKSNLLKSRFTTNQQQIIKREFFTYDGNGEIAQETWDDGSETDPDDLKGLTERHLKITTARTQEPIGLPECIEEYYFEKATGNFQLLKKIINTHSSQGKVLHQEHYGSDGQYAYTLHWEYDHLGNIIALLDTEGQLVESYRYTSFGETQVFNPGQQINNPWRYSSKRFDQETGFFYFGQRYYAPEIGRWITPDPAGFADGSNLYAYVHNQPLRYIDPDGRFAMFLIPIAISMAAEYCLPAASVYLAEYAGGTAVAGLLTGLIRGYNGSIFEPSVFDGIDPTAAFLEKGGMCVGTALSLNLASIAKKGGTAACNAFTNLATKELTSAGTNVIAAKVSRSITWFSSSCARRTAISQTAQKSLQGAEGSVIKEGVALSCGAESVNAATNLKNKLSLLESFPKDSVKNRLLSDGRIRYYAPEITSRTSGPTRGAGSVVEWNPKTGNVRGWYECRDHLGRVNRVHPKNINGQVVSSPHYPPISKEIIR